MKKNRFDIVNIVKGEDRQLKRLRRDLVALRLKVDV